MIQEIHMINIGNKSNYICTTNYYPVPNIDISFFDAFAKFIFIGRMSIGIYVYMLFLYIDSYRSFI